MLHKTLLSTLLFFGLTTTSLLAMDLDKVTSMLPGNEPSAAQNVAKAVGGNDLTTLLVNQLGVTENQASGGAGSILNYAKQSLSPKDFSKVASSVPGIDSLLSAAPSVGGGLSSVTGALGGNAGGMAAVASQFSSLGLKADMIQQFTPVILDYVKGTGGSDVMKLLAGIF